MNVLPSMQAWYEANVAASAQLNRDTESPKLLRTKAPKAPKTPKERFPLTDLEKRAVICLGGCRYTPGSGPKYFARNMQGAEKLTAGQREYLWECAHRFRRQIKDREVVWEAHRRHEAERSGAA